MLFDSKGLPKDVGATDYMDSARLAGIMATFGHPSMSRPVIRQYVVGNQGVRYPYMDSSNPASNNPKNFTRDQLTCLASGLKALDSSDLCNILLHAAKERGNRAQNTEKDVVGSTKQFPDGADLLTPDVMSHISICANQAPTLSGKAWLIMDILVNAFISPMNEPNQLMCMCKTAGPMYVKLLRKLNPKLDAAIRSYWGGWRKEPDFAEFLIRNFN